VEGKAVGGLGGHVGDAGEELLVGEVDHGEDLLGVDVGCAVSIPSPFSHFEFHTLVLGGAGDLAEQLDKVGQVIAEELGLKHEVLARVVGVEAGAQKLRLADNAQRRPSLGSLVPERQLALGCVLAGQDIRTRKAKLARPSVRPGSGWKRVPAFATRASVVVGPAKSLLAYLTPLASPDWYWKEPEAGAASPRRWHWETGGTRAARCAPRQAVVRESIVWKAPGGGLIRVWGTTMDGKASGGEAW
jgi:hypothetical protein